MLFNCLEACPHGVNFVELEEFAVKSLRHVSRTLAMDAEYIMNGFYEGRGASKSQCPHRTASSTAAQGEGKSQGKGSQSMVQS
jgi:hypothetical protein